MLKSVDGVWVCSLFNQESVTKYSKEQGPAQQWDLELKVPFIKGSGHTPQDNNKDLTRNQKLFIKLDFLWGYEGKQIWL